ncbi:heavy-metal-associated domain-containing protein [Miltoncostaea oceani]|uniref:heavy-metal-associated domain-containing protein n=1 Tax=Miltoncostaea oceani TaxID=2843216 RepID=UPI001C3CA1F5|nr:cation transporter [Miltoncostaea oceani]
MSDERTYHVDGMTCGHCRVAVLEEVGALAGVDEVEVDLATGRMVVRGDAVDDGAVATAVDEAGYEVRS